MKEFKEVYYVIFEVLTATLSSAMLRRVVWLTTDDVSEVLTAHIITADCTRQHHRRQPSQSLLRSYNEEQQTARLN